jgi:hypothetical protein
MLDSPRSARLSTARHNPTLGKITVFLERQAQDANSRIGAVWGVLPANA